MSNKQYFLHSTLSLLLVTALAKAEAINTIDKNYGWTPESGRVLLSGTASNIGIFGGDGMLPVYGNKDGFLYGDFMGDYGTDDTYLVSPGGGFRQVVGNQIMGAYFFGDYEKTSLGTNFWNLSPGIEWMSTHWDAHANGYFPTSTSQQSGSGLYASDFGDTSNVYFEEGTNNQYDEQVTPYAVIGNGVDAELGYSFAGKDNLRSRVYLGGYYYAPPSSDNVENITGVTAGFEQPISENLAFAIRNSYDQVSLYTVGVSLTVTFGGESNTFSNNVRDRFLDPVQRHVGIIGTGAGTYDQQYLQNEGVGLQYDNVYFVSDDGTGNGTYGSSAPLTQDTLDMIDSDSPGDSRIYVQGGTDATYYVNSETTNTSGGYGDPSDQGLMLASGQSIFGRSEDFTAPASEDAQPTIMVDTANGYNGFIISDVDGTTNTISDITLVGNSTELGSGIVVYESEENDITLNVNNTHISGFNTGISAENNGAGTLLLNVENSALNNNQDGMSIYDQSGIFTMNATNTSFDNNNDGINAYNAGGTLTINMMNTSSDDNMLTGLIVHNINGDSSASTTLNISGSSFDNNGTNGLEAGRSNGNAALTVNVVDSTFDNNASTGLSFYSFSGPSVATLTADSASFSNNGVYGMSVINAGDSSITATATNSVFDGNQYGMQIFNVSSTGTLMVTDLSGSSFNNTYYGIVGTAYFPGLTMINYTNATFSGDTQIDTNEESSTNVDWIH